MAANPGDRTKAARLRRQLEAGQAVSNIDALWLQDYEEKQKRGGQSKHYGRSRSARKVNATFNMEEAAEAEGTGDAAPTAAAAAVGEALKSREEGRRLDSLTTSAVGALKEAVNTYKEICLSMRDRLEILEATHISMLEGVREHFAARTEAEMALIQEQDRRDPAKDLLTMMVAKRLGIPMDQLPPPGRRPRRPPPGSNGKPE
jgi:hypothetical protein